MEWEQFSLLDSLGTIPELVHCMMQFLDLSDIADLMCVSKVWCATCRSNAFWRRQLKRDFDSGLIEEELTEESDSGWRLYRKTWTEAKVRRNHFLVPFTQSYFNEETDYSFKNHNNHFIARCYRGEMNAVEQWLLNIGYTINGQTLQRTLDELQATFMYYVCSYTLEPNPVLPTDKTVISRKLINLKSYYHGWTYFGNYTDTHHACIRRGLDLDTKQSRYPRSGNDATDIGIFYPSIETTSPCWTDGMKKECLGTPLHWACMAGKLDVVKLLCAQEGIDINATVDAYNATGEDIARANGFFDVASFLKKCNKQRR